MRVIVFLLRREMYFMMKQRDGDKSPPTCAAALGLAGTLKFLAERSFHLSILPLTSLIWITRPDWWLAHFKPFPL